jgi:putative N6-adenine-specific DNA methylase
LNFAALKIKDAVADRFRNKSGVRPDVDTRWPDSRIYAHLTTDELTLYIDTSGEPLFKRGWRMDKGEAPLKETLAAAMLAAVGWTEVREGGPACLYDPCCGSGTIAIEAAQIECAIAPGLLRRFGFENLLPHQSHAWEDLKAQARALEREPVRRIYGSDVSFRMVDFANNNAERAGVSGAIEFRGGDALQRMPPSEEPGVLLLNPPYDERIQIGGIAGAEALARSGARERAHTDNDEDFFQQLASHWKKNFSSWTGWILTPNLKLPGQMRLKETRRVPLWNGPIECRLFRFDMVKGKLKPDAQGMQGAQAPGQQAL